MSRESESQGTGSFRVGAVVAVRADKARTGPIIEELPAVAGRRRFRVFHSVDSVREYSEDQLVSAEIACVDQWANAIVSEQWLDPSAFRARLTATRLDNPQVDHLYSGSSDVSGGGLI